MNLWPFSHYRDRADCTDERLADLDERIAAAAEAVERNEPRVNSAKSRAERAAARRAAAIERNHFSEMFANDLRGGHP